MASGSAGRYGGPVISEPVKVIDKRKTLPTIEERKRAKEADKKRKQDQQQKGRLDIKKSSKKVKNVSTVPWLATSWDFKLNNVHESNCVLL